MKIIDRMVSAIAFIALLLLWEVGVRWANIPAYTLPPPSLIISTWWANLGALMVSWIFTLKITLFSLLLACVTGVVVASFFSLSRQLEQVLLPMAVMLQVTPVVAIAPLILIYVSSTTAALLLCAWIVAFFPIMSNTVAGLRSADPQLADLMRIYQATPFQRLRLLLIPSAMPYFLAGLRISGGLSLIGAVTAEMVAGVAGHETGLASAILEASFRTDTPKMFAALGLLVLTGIMIYAVLNALSRLLLGCWHPNINAS